jgi:ribosomal protein S12 methylthiotransferase accessory factor YcaO
LIRAQLSQLRQQNRLALDPNRIGLEVPYHDAPLHWIQGFTADAAGAEPIWVPAQCVFLFCNLDETKLFSGLGSNGLGAGVTMAQAKCQALLEVIERDCAATIPYTPELRFDIETGDARIGRLLQSYAAVNIHVGFMDITGPLGVPCCKSFVMGADGEITTGSAAHLDARRALLSALTETPYPFPHGPPSHPLQPAKVRVPLEALPSYDQGDAHQNLQLLEQLLLMNGFEPIYVDLTRADLNLPVVRAIVPGMEMLGDFDRCSRVHPRLYGHYLKYAPGAPIDSAIES